MAVFKNTAHSGANGAKGSNNEEHRIEPGRTATQSAEARLSGPMRLHQLAKRDRSLQFNNLLQHLNPERLIQAYQCLNKQSAKGVDGESWASYGSQLESRINNLHNRIHSLKPVLRKPRG